MNTIARADQPQLLSRGDKRGLQLFAGILPQAAESDLAHFMVQTGETPKFIEDAQIPEEVISGRRQPVTIRAELISCGGTMVVEIALDDPILQHASEYYSIASRRPGELPRKCEIADEQHRGTSRDAGPAAQQPAPIA